MHENEGIKRIEKQHSEMIAHLTEVVKEPIKKIHDFYVAIGIAISRVELPKIDFHAVEIEWESIKALINNNTLHGWTFTGEMAIGFYLNDDLLQLKQEEIDELFVEYYEYNSKENFLTMKLNILDEIDDRWESVLVECFELYEQDKYKVIIPMLISIIEGEISDIAKSLKVGRNLFDKWEGQIVSEKDELAKIVSHSIYRYLSSHLFRSKKFTEERGSALNRNWILHGRDNPDYWTKVDALKLINVISSLQFVKSE